MAGQTDGVKPPGLLWSKQVLHSAFKRDDLLPFLLGFEIVQGGNVDVAGAQLVRDVVELSRRIRGGSRLKLNGHNHLGSFRFREPRWSGLSPSLAARQFKRRFQRR